MQKGYVWSSVGAMLMLLGMMMTIPAAAGLYYRETEYVAFLLSAGTAVLAGFLLYFFSFYNENSH